jgi:hypothetical protein
MLRLTDGPTPEISSLLFSGQNPGAAIPIAERNFPKNGAVSTGRLFRHYPPLIA